MESTELVVVEGLSELIEILSNDNSGQIVELLTENNSYFDTEIYDLIAALNDIYNVLCVFYVLFLFVIAWKLAVSVVGVINQA